MSVSPDNSLVNARDKELLSRAEYAPYVQTHHGECHSYCYRPSEDLASSEPRPAIVFFHGGLFDQRLPGQFAPHCLHFASRGMVAFSVEYRVSNLYGTGPLQALEDARSFLSYITEHHTHYNIDPQKIVVGGSASGGYLASHLCSRHKNNLNLIGELTQPCAQILYSPVVNTTHKGLCNLLFPDSKTAKRLSPSEQITKDYPPTMIFHGKVDKVVPFQHSKKYVKSLLRKKNKVELVEFEAARHIDFNLNVNPQYYDLTLRSADYFLTDLGLVEPAPDLFLD